MLTAIKNSILFWFSSGILLKLLTSMPKAVSYR